MDDDRYSRQQRFAAIGMAGQRRLASARVLVLGCGALGSAGAEQLARAGVGSLVLVDRDLVERSNLQRQCLFSEADAAAALPKAEAAVRRLAAVNGSIELRAVVTHVEAGNVLGLLEGVDLVLDGSDNFAVRHLLNDACCRLGLPWVHGACVGAYGLSVPILPGRTPCLRCLQDELPAPGEVGNCDSLGIIAPAVHLVAAWQVAEVLKILVGDLAALRQQLWACDLWQNRFQHLHLPAAARDPACRSCGPQADHPALRPSHEAPVLLCGRDAVQLASRGPLDLSAVAHALGDRIQQSNPWLLRWQDGSLTATVFADGRLLVQGTHDPGRAEALRDRWLG